MIDFINDIEVRVCEQCGRTEPVDAYDKIMRTEWGSDICEECEELESESSPYNRGSLAHAYYVRGV